MALLAMGGVGSSLWFSIRLGGGTGRRTGLKIRSPARGVRVRPPSRALSNNNLRTFKNSVQGEVRGVDVKIRSLARRVRFQFLSRVLVNNNLGRGQREDKTG